MKHLKYSKLIAISLSLLIAAGIIDAQNTPIPNDSTVHIGKLPNGLTYYIQKNKKPEKRIELRLAVNAGSVQEDDDQLGLAHFCEHMCFNGTSHFPKNDLIHYLQSVGVNFGPEINGYTSFNETVYMLTLPSDSVKIVNNGFQIMADWAHAVTFDTAEINKERGVLIEEWRNGRGAGQRMRDKYLPVALYGSKYAKRLPIGTKESIEKSSFNSIKRFYTDWYRPDLMAFIVVGDINPDSVENKIKAYFSTIPTGSSQRIKEEYKISDNKEPLLSIVTDKENTGISIEISLKTPKKIEKTLDDLGDQIMHSMFCNMINQRLNEITKKPNTPFMSSGLGFGSFWVRTCDAYTVSIRVKEDSVLTGIKAVMTEIERAKRYGFLQAELDRVKLNMIKGLENAYNERDKRESGNLVGSLVDNYLESSPIIDIAFIYNYVKEKLPSIKLSDVDKLVNDWAKEENKVIIITGIEKQGLTLPKESQVLSAINEVRNIKIEPYKEDKLAKELIAKNKKPAPGKIVSEKAIGTLNITELKLSNGLTVILKPTDFKNDEIQMNSFSEGGNSSFGREYKLSADFVTSIVCQGGVGQFPLIDLNKMLAGKNVGVSPYISSLYSGFSGSSSVADLETLFQLVYLYFTEPRRDVTTYEAFVQRTRESYKNLLSNPRNYFSNEANKIRYRNSPEIPGLFPVEEDWNNLSIDKAFEIYKKNFSNASNFTFMFVGSFKPEVIKPLIKTYLGALPTKNKPETYVDKKIRPAEGPINENIYKGKDPKALVTLSLSSPAKFSKLNAHVAWSLGNILQRIYTDKLREDMSGVYSIGLSCTIAKEPYENFSFGMNIPCAPENADKLVNAVYAEIERIKKEGVTADELKKEVESQIRGTEVNEKLNGWWMYYLNLILKTEKEYGRLEKPNELSEMLSSDLIKEIANKYFDTSKMVRITLLPEDSKKESVMK
jgi:zinc protease